MKKETQKEPTTLWSTRLTAEQLRRFNCIKAYRGQTKSGVNRVWISSAYSRLPDEAK